MMYVLTLSYDGTRYFGWQKTKTGPSIQETLERAILKITQETVSPEAASRTDRGVHAEGQIVAFPLQKDWEVGRLQQALNAVLPRDIRVKEIKKAVNDFHPTLHAREKVYHYQICRDFIQPPNLRLYSWHFRFPLDLSLMKQAAQSLIGTFDFTAFANEEKEDPICTLTSIEFSERDLLQVAFRGNRFLYKMVRNLAGTLLYIGCGKLPADSIPRLLASRDRKRAGMTAPAHGLFLHRVEYYS